MYNKRAQGRNYELLAADFLRDNGYFIIEMNYNVRQAEIDIIARDGKTIVFVEVKFRSGTSGGHPLESVDLRKQKKICHAALFYMNQKKISTDNTPIRFDVIGILREDIIHVKNAFDFIY